MTKSNKFSKRAMLKRSSNTTVFQINTVRNSRDGLPLFRRFRLFATGFLGLALAAVALLAVKENDLLFGFSGPQPNSGARQISAHPNLSRVIDADTIVVGEIRVRLDGISAPERGHDAYTKGKWFVADLMREAEMVECDLEGRKSYDREVGACFFVMPDGTRVDPQAEAVKAGLARDCPRYSGGRYRSIETSESRALPLPGYC